MMQLFLCLFFQKKKLFELPIKSMWLHYVSTVWFYFKFYTSFYSSQISCMSVVFTWLLQTKLSRQCETLGSIIFQQFTHYCFYSFIKKTNYLLFLELLVGFWLFLYCKVLTCLLQWYVSLKIYIAIYWVLGGEELRQIYC